MRMLRILLLSLIVLFQLHLSGCGSGPMPKTAEDFRLAVPGSSSTEKETFEVNRTFDDVVAIFKKKAVPCLDVTVKTTSQTAASNWNPTLIVTPNKAELHIQRIVEQDVMKAPDEHEKGHFVMVVDITPASAKKTRIDMYRPTMGVDVIVKALKNWAQNKDIGCPDMTKIKNL